MKNKKVIYKYLILIIVIIHFHLWSGYILKNYKWNQKSFREIIYDKINKLIDS